MLVGTGELKLEELQRAAQALRSRLPGGRPAAPDPR
jgi:hypothetical protein